jgi:Trk K+ transport system NAD-binding subunit
MPAARGLTRPIIAGRRFVIHGLSRLTVRVARLLAEDLAEVVVVAHEEGRPLAPLLGNTAQVVWADGDQEAAFAQAGLAGSQALLVLGEDDLHNLQAAVVGNALAPAVPVVLRIFNPVLAEQFAAGLNVRRAYSVSALSAPAFVAAALSEQVVQTMHLGDDEVAVCRVGVNPGSPLGGRSADALEREFHLALLAQGTPEGTWEAATGSERIAEGDEVLVGGPMIEVLRLAVRDHTIFGRPKAGRRRRRRTPWARGSRRPRPATLLPAVGAVLAGLLVAMAVVFGVAFDLDPIHAAYFTVTTAFGEFTLNEASSGLRTLGIVAVLAGGALFGVLFSYLASVATTQRLEQRAGRRAQRLSGHVVVAGMGTVGYRVVTLLDELGIAVAAIERSADSRFRDAVGDRAPVLSGDVRLPESLDRAGVSDAECLVACTDDDLANVLACLHARRANPGIRTVARIFDESLAARVGSAFGIDVALSATGVAAGAFAAAATDERAPVAFDTGPVRHLVLREDFDDPVDLQTVRSWEREGLHLLAFRRGSGEAEPPSALGAPLRDGDSAVLAGPEAVVRRILLGPG